MQGNTTEKKMKSQKYVLYNPYMEPQKGQGYCGYVEKAVDKE